ncbi:MAG: 5-formyltetrahydrofolate cyclo-ligase, partial [Betaproteobacteria bacterium]
MLARRESVPPAEHAQWSARIVAHALGALPRPRIAAFCWPVRNEPDVRALLATWARGGTLAALPVVVADG